MTPKVLKVLYAAIAGAAFVGAMVRDVSAQEKIYPRLVDAEIEKAIGRGLEFLARTQNRDGSWRGSGGYGVYPTAMTALAGMALIGSGATPTRSRHPAS